MAAAPSSWRKAPQTAFIAVFLSVFSAVNSTSQVPLLLWSSEGLPALAPPAAGHITSVDELTSDLSAVLSAAPRTLLLFLQDKLSKDDFTVFGGAFGDKQDSAFQNIEAALRSSAAILLPAVAWSGSSAVLPLLQDQLGVAPLLVDAETLSHLSINTSVSNLLLINLPYCAGSHKSCREVLHKNDKTIGEVLGIMKEKNAPYTAIYTGQQPSRVISELPVSDRSVGRSLLQSADPVVKPPLTFNTTSGPCIMLWAQNLNVSVSSPESWIDLGAQTPSTAGSVCNNTSAILVLTYPTGHLLRFSMSQRFYPVSARNWFSLDSVQLQVNEQTASFSGGRGVYAPAEYSFHCQSVNSFRDALLLWNATTSPSNTSTWRLNFIDFQIQGFGLANGTNFSYASDCAGFFTAGIWMGLITGLLMLLIFVYGLHMIMQLNTMDRFDDPKGPSISVPQSE